MINQSHQETAPVGGPAPSTSVVHVGGVDIEQLTATLAMLETYVDSLLADIHSVSTTVRRRIQ